jgi:hypothetical protein
MKKSLEEVILFYKNLYGGESEVVFKEDSVLIPKWLEMLVLHRSGLKTRKKRIVNKVLKREIDSMLTAYTQSNTN